MNEVQRRLLNEVLKELKYYMSNGTLVHYTDEFDGKMRDYDITLERQIESLEQVLKEAT
tara:strand:- start:265 stop:441 length:177 start_codon:yes stop_codon:yes gene_type:complete